jgi:hypothetical protein
VLARQTLYILLAMSLALFVFIIFEVGSCFMPGSAWTTALLFMPPYIAGDRHIYHTQSLVEMWLL